jgi:hypothetical protein
MFLGRPNGDRNGRVAPPYDPLERRTNNPQVGGDKFLRGKQKRRHEDNRVTAYVLRFSYSFRPMLVDAIAQSDSFSGFLSGSPAG